MDGGACFWEPSFGGARPDTGSLAALAPTTTSFWPMLSVAPASLELAMKNIFADCARTSPSGRSRPGEGVAPPPPRPASRAEEEALGDRVGDAGVIMGERPRGGGGVIPVRELRRCCNCCRGERTGSWGGISCELAGEICGLAPAELAVPMALSCGERGTCGRGWNNGLCTTFSSSFFSSFFFSSFFFSSFSSTSASSLDMPRRPDFRRRASSTCSTSPARLRPREDDRWKRRGVEGDGDCREDKACALVFWLMRWCSNC
mmetsp:Transcript_34541/g.86774  ORF Transcript_34541/g.86774 Transcript_34541/m.86774 type:complete len:260 (-) Transcript_34541:574-1353(-)